MRRLQSVGTWMLYAMGKRVKACRPALRPDETFAGWCDGAVHGRDELFNAVAYEVTALDPPPGVGPQHLAWRRLFAWHGERAEEYLTMFGGAELPPEVTHLPMHILHERQDSAIVLRHPSQWRRVLFYEHRGEGGFATSGTAVVDNPVITGSCPFAAAPGPVPATGDRVQCNAITFDARFDIDLAFFATHGTPPPDGTLLIARHERLTLTGQHIPSVRFGIPYARLASLGPMPRYGF